MDEKSFKVDFPNENRSVRLIPGNSVMDALLKADLKADMACGGNGICGKCIIRLISGKLEGGKIEDDFFLACRAIPLTDCEIEVVTRQGKVETVPFTGGIIPGINILNINPPSLQSLNPNDPLIKNALGAAIDIGTTTVAGVLCRLSSGEILSFESTGNPQSIYGADVISRITHASDSNGLDDLHRLIVKCVNEMIDVLCRSSKTERVNLLDIVVSGNAAMNHLFIGKSPASLGFAPYKPFFKIHEPVPAIDLGISANSMCTIKILPNIEGFVGGDAVAGILATEIDRSEKPKLLIDIGTNGEIVLSDGKNLYACSAAAGPAFEGGRIIMGMR
ncbi:MAG: ASKHA domain-containing protein, partial [bacterium]